MTPQWQPVVKTKASVLFQWFVFEGHRQPQYVKSLDLDFGLSNQRIVADEISIDLNEFNRLETILDQRLTQDPDFIQQYINRCYHYASTLLDTAQTIGASIKQTASSQSLKNQYQTYQTAVLDLMPFLNTTLVIDGVLRKHLINSLRNDLKITDSKDQDQLISYLIIPVKPNYFVQANEAVLNMALTLHQNPQADINQEIASYLNQFAWMSTNAYLGSFLTENEVREKITQLLQEDPTAKQVELNTTKQETLAKYTKARQRLAHSPAALKLVDIAQELLYLQTYRLDVFFKAYFHAYPLFQTIAKSFQLTPAQLVYLTGPEIQAGFSGESIPAEMEITSRQTAYALILENDQFTMQSGEQVQLDSATTTETTVTGKVANRGRAVGTARLVNSLEDIDKVNRGDILISVNTIPPLLPAMVKSSGIITDVGGMLSHAAIVSREFGIPCLVGTKTATKVFTDGDQVELNAYDGIARKLPKS